MKNEQDSQPPAIPPLPPATGSVRRMYGDDPMDWASNMAACAAERALTRDWQEHPMFGIAVDKDKWAVGYQNAAAKLKAMVSAPNPKLSDRGARRGGCMVGERRRPEAAAVTCGAVRCSAWLGVSFDGDGRLRIEPKDECVVTLDTGETVVVPKKDFGRVAVIGYGMSLGSLLSLARTSVLNALPEFVEGDVPRLRLDLGDTGDLPDKKETVPV